MVTLIIVVWVDDMVIAGQAARRIERFKADFSEHFIITDLGEICYVLGILVSRDRANRLIYLSQEAYLKQVLERFGMASAHPVSTPLTVGCILSASQSPATEKERQEYVKYSNNVHYLALVGSLLYATQT